MTADPDFGQWAEENQLGADERRVLRRMFTAGGRYPHSMMVKDFPPNFQLSAGGEVLVEGVAGRYILERLEKLGLITPTSAALYRLTDFGAQVAGALELAEGIHQPALDENTKD